MDLAYFCMTQKLTPTIIKEKAVDFSICANITLLENVNWLATISGQYIDE